MTIDLTKIDKPFGELDRATRGALLLAAHEGEVIEFYDPYEDVPVQSSVWPLRWYDDRVYRVKLRADSIDWSQVAEGWDWMAREEDGRAFFFRSKPVRGELAWNDFDGSEVLVVVSSYVRGTCDWKDSLITRPGKE